MFQARANKILPEKSMQFLGSPKKKNLSERAWSVFLVAFPFMDIFLSRYSFQLFPGPLGYGPFLCMYALMPFFVVRYQFPVRVAAILALVGIIGSFGLLNEIVNQGDFIKVFGSLVIPYFYYWYLWQYLGEDVIKGFRIYLNLAVAASVFGLLQFVDSIIPFGFNEFVGSIIRIPTTPATFGIRVNSTLGEPTYFANTISPAGFFALFRLFFAESSLAQQAKKNGLWLSRKAAAVILIALVLTYSTMAFLGIFISLIFHLLIKRQIRALLFIPVVVFGLYSAATSIPEINERIEGLQNASAVEEEDIHGSSAVLYNHAIITWENFRRNPLFGTGLGSHAEATDRYTILRGTGLYAYTTQNATDASSMFLRITSELGLFGIFLILVFLIRNYFVVPEWEHEGLVLKMISAAFLVSILLQLFRQGNFILNGFPFFVFGYYLTWKQYRNRMKPASDV